MYAYGRVRAARLFPFFVCGLCSRIRATSYKVSQGDARCDEPSIYPSWCVHALLHGIDFMVTVTKDGVFV
jgi:hypothetical protein